MLNKYLAYLFLMFISGNVGAQNCEVPQILMDEYEKDVKHPLSRAKRTLQQE